MNGDDYLQMFQNRLIDQLIENGDEFIIFMENGTDRPLNVSAYLNGVLPERWIGRDTEGDDWFLRWQPRSHPIFLHVIFFSGVM